MVDISENELQIYEYTRPSPCDYMGCRTFADWQIGRPRQGSQMRICDTHMRELVRNVARRFPDLVIDEVGEERARYVEQSLEILEALRNSTWQEPGWMSIPGVEKSLRVPQKQSYDRLMNFVVSQEEADEEPEEPPEDEEGGEE